MFCRTALNLAIFTQSDSPDLLVEMSCCQGDRGMYIFLGSSSSSLHRGSYSYYTTRQLTMHTSLGAFQKLCEYIYQRCGLRHITESDPISASNATEANIFPNTQQYIAPIFEGQIKSPTLRNSSTKHAANGRHSDLISTPARNANTMLSKTLPGSPLQLHLHDSDAPLPFPAKKLPGRPNDDSNPRQILRMLVKRQASVKGLGVGDYMELEQIFAVNV